MTMMAERIERLILTVDHNHGTDSLSHRPAIIQAVHSLPVGGQHALCDLDQCGMPFQSLIDLAACILSVRLSERDPEDAILNGPLHAMHAVMGAAIAIGGGYNPPGMPRNDPDCVVLIETGIVQSCLDIACRSPSSTLSPYARRLVGLTTINLAVASMIGIRTWPRPSSTLDDIAAMTTLTIERKAGFYHNMLTPDDVWNAFTDTVLFVERHAACTRQAMNALVNDIKSSDKPSAPRYSQRVLN